MREVLTAVLPKDSYVFSVQIDLKKVSGKTNTAIKPQGDLGAIPLSKLDLNAPAFQATEVEKTNLFKNIASVRVMVFIDQAVPDSHVEMVQRIFRELYDGAGKGIEEVRVERAEFKVDENKQPAGWPSTLLKYQSLVGMGAICLVILLLGSMLLIAFFRVFRSRENSITSPLVSSTASSSQAGSRSQATKENRLTRSSPNGFSSSQGIANFRKLLQDDMSACASLVRGWLYLEDPLSTSALRYLGATLEVDHLKKILNVLTPSERRTWKNRLSQFQSDAENEMSGAAADSFISQTIASELLSEPSYLKGDDQFKLFSAHEETWAQLAKADPLAGSLLARILPVHEAARLLEHVGKAHVLKIAATGLRTTADELRKAIPEIVEAASNGTSSEMNTEFLNRLGELLLQSSPEIEASVFDAVRSTGKPALRHLALLVTPSDVLLNLPARALRPLLAKMPMRTIAELIVTVDRPTRDKMLDLCGEAQSRIRVSTEAELTALEADKLRRDKVIEKKSETWANFIREIRNLVSADTTLQETVHELTQVWLEREPGKHSGSAATREAA